MPKTIDERVVYNYEDLCEHHDCDACGMTHANGFHLYSNGATVMELEPVASCVSPVTLYNEQALVLLIEALGNKYGFAVNGLPNIDYGNGRDVIKEHLQVHEDYK